MPPAWMQGAVTLPRPLSTPLNLQMSYLADMISPVGNGSQRLQSAAHGNLVVPRTRTVRMGQISFAVSGPTLSNFLPVELKTSNIPLETFKSKLKTYLF